MNLMEKILARASGKDTVTPGEVVFADVDRLIYHDISGYITNRVFENEVKRAIKYPERIIMAFDHTFSPPTEARAQVLDENRRFCEKYGAHLLDCGCGNIHNAVVRGGFIRPGMVVVGSDSHTPVHGTLGCLAVALGNDSHAATVMPFGKAWFRVPETIRVNLTGETKPGVTPRDVALWLTGKIGEGGAVYKAMHFGGDYIERLGLWDRWIFPCITIDIGAKCSFIEPDEKVTDFFRTITDEPLDIVTSDPDCVYEDIWTFDVGEAEPLVAATPTLGNLKTPRSLAGTAIQWAELGGHCGGRLEDIEEAVKILAGKKIAHGVKMNIVPSSREVFAEACRKGYVLTLHEAGCTWFPPSTGSNQAVNMGAMVKTESMISTHSRNFPGRNGSPEAMMYLAAASTVAASALKGTITDPRDL